VITKFNHEKVKDPRDLARRVANVQPGEKSSITVWRNGKDVEMPINIAKYDDNTTAQNFGNDNGSQNSDQGMDVPSLGFSLSDLTPDVRKNYQIPDSENGAVISNVDPNKSAGEHGMREGDVIVAVNQQKVTSAQDVQKAIKSAKQDGRKSVLLLIQRNGSQSFIALPFGNA
ncbi:MAG: PDZ domain-containing protein, partial [Pararhizobium sp.]